MSRGKLKKRSLTSSLRNEGRIDGKFVDTLSTLSMEDIIALKLEASTKMTKGKFYGFPIWYSLPNICKEACFKFAVYNCKTKSDITSLLGIEHPTTLELYKKFNFDIEEE